MTLADVGDELFDAGTPGCFQYHSNIQMPMRASGGIASSELELLLQSGDMDLLVDAELGDLLQAIDHVGTLRQHQQHVRVGGARLDQIAEKSVVPSGVSSLPVIVPPSFFRLASARLCKV